MAELAIIFTVITILAVCGMVGVLFVKSSRANKVIFILLAILTITVSAMSAMALPSNYVVRQIVAWSWSGIALIGTILRFRRTKYQGLAKYVLVASTIGALISLMVI